MLLRDLAFAGRTLRKSPVFALTAAITIALGVGSSTAIFSVTNAVLLRPLPYKDPDQLVIIPTDMRNRGVKDFPFSNANFIDLREATKNEFQGLGGVFTFPFTLTGEDGTPEQVHMGFVTTNYLRLVGAKIAFGRDFSDDDGQPQPPPPAPGTQSATPPQRLPLIAIISYEYFQRQFGANPAVLGQSLNKGKPFSPRIVGVLAPHFQIYFPPSSDLEASPEIWIANRLGYDAEQRNSVSMRVIGRLQPGISIGQAQAAADQVAAEARRNFKIENTAGYAIRVEPMRQHLVSEVRPVILALMGSVIFLLLIACANVANLLLVRASLRERELAIRTAIGASRWDLARQILSEALLLAAIGALGGLGLAWLGIHELLAIAPAQLPRLDTIRIDSTVLVFTVILSLIAAAIFGLAPAWRAARPDVMIVLRGTSRSEGLASGGLSRKIVVGLEVALAYVLLIGSGLMVRSFLELQRVDPGFNPHGLLTFQVRSDRFLQKPEERAVASRQLEERLRTIPGVQSLTASNPFPLTGGYSPIRWGTEEALTDASRYKAVDPLIVLPGYFETMHTPLLERRTFTDEDNQPGRTQVVVDKILADRAYPGQPSVGKHSYPHSNAGTCVGGDHWRRRSRARCLVDRARTRASLFYRRVHRLRRDRSLGATDRQRSIEVRERCSRCAQDLRFPPLDHRHAAHGCCDREGASRHALFLASYRIVCGHRSDARRRRSLRCACDRRAEAHRGDRHTYGPGRSVQQHFQTRRRPGTSSRWHRYCCRPDHSVRTHTRDDDDVGGC